MVKDSRRLIAIDNVVKGVKVVKVVKVVKHGFFRRSLCAFALCFVSCYVAAWASIYAYTDAQGRIRITDIPDRDGREIVLPQIARRPGLSSLALLNPRTLTAYPGPCRSPEEFRGTVREAARANRISESLIYAVMKAESNFNPNAFSHCGAEGLMQLIPSTARVVGVTNSFDPHQNIHGGSKYLRMMLDRFGRVDLALAAYNAGPEAVERSGGIPPFDETRNYVPRVLKYYREFGGAGELVLASAYPRPSVSLSALPGQGPGRASATSRRSAASRTTRTLMASNAPPPIFYSRGPDGQIYLYNK